MQELLPSEWLLREVLWGVPTWRVGAAALLIFLGTLTRPILRFIFYRILRPRVGKTRMQWDDDVVELTPRPLAFVIQIGLWWVALNMMLVGEDLAVLRGYVSSGFLAALGVALGWALFRVVEVLGRAMTRAADRTDTRLDDQAVPLVQKALKIFIAVTIAVSVIDTVGLDVKSLLASIGVGGLALALAAKDTVSNFFGSLVIFTDRPFQIGDWVSFGSVEGTVEEVGFRTTRIRKFDKALVTVPNQTFTTTAIVNHSNRDKRRIKLVVGVSYETTADQMRTLLERLQHLVTIHPGIDQGFHMVKFTGFGASSLDILIYCFSETAVWAEYLTIQENLMLRIMEIIAEPE